MKKVKNSDLNLVLEFIQHLRKSDKNYLDLNGDLPTLYMEGKHDGYTKIEKFISDLDNDYNK